MVCGVRLQLVFGRRSRGAGLRHNNPSVRARQRRRDRWGRFANEQRSTTWRDVGNIQRVAAQSYLDTVRQIATEQPRQRVPYSHPRRARALPNLTPVTGVSPENSAAVFQQMVGWAARHDPPITVTPMSERAASPDELGVCHHDRKTGAVTIEIASDQDAHSAVATLAHELAHIYDPWTAQYGHDSDHYHQRRAAYETVAQIAAADICQAFGVDCDDRTAAYVQHWVGYPPDRVRRNRAANDRIRSIVHQVVEGVAAQPAVAV